MGSGGGDENPLEQIRKNPLGTIANVATQVATYGLVGYENGHFGQGVVTHGLDEGIGELTGRNLARKEQMNAADRLRAEEARMAQERVDELAKRQREDINASMAAGAGGRAFGAKKSLNYAGIDNEEDLLGL